MSDTRTELRRPFTSAAIKMKPQATTGEGEQMKGLVTFYIDARLAAARLTAVVGDDWHDDYDVLIRHPEAVKVGIPIECRLTVGGVTRVDVGQIAPGECDDKAWKSAYSDAFKRAAVKFEVGAYLYGGPQVWAPVKARQKNGKWYAQGFTPEGITQARRSYEAWIGSKAMKDIYGEPLDHGDVLVEGSDEAASTPVTAKKPGTASSPGVPTTEPVSSGILEGEPKAAEPVTPAVSQAGVSEPASPSEDPVMSSFKQRGDIAQLIVEAAKANNSTGPKLTEALTAQYGPFDKLTAAQADELIGKLARWADNAKAAA